MLSRFYWIVDFPVFNPIQLLCFIVNIWKDSGMGL